MDEITKFITDNQLYLEFLEIKESEIPRKNNSIDKQEICKLVEQQFRKLARKYHPDYGGTDEKFKFLSDCKNKILNNNSQESQFSLSFDASKYENYNEESLAAMLGNQLFDLISAWKDQLNIKPMSRPKDAQDEYEWTFKEKTNGIELCLNVQNLSHELAELSNELYKEDSLSVLVCLFIPTNKLSVTKVAYDDSTLLTFNDTILIESSSSAEIFRYFSSHENILKDLEQITSGTFVSRQNKELKTKTVQEATEKDREILQKLQDMKLFSKHYDEHAADFLNDLGK